jgi:hypothetical protein
MNRQCILVRCVITTLAVAVLLSPSVAAPQQTQRDHTHSGRSEHSFADAERYASIFDSPERARWQILRSAPGGKNRTSWWRRCKSVRGRW